MRPPTNTIAAVTYGGSSRSVAELLMNTEWMLPSPATQIHTISIHSSRSDSLSQTLPPFPHKHHQFAFSNRSQNNNNNNNGKAAAAASELGSFHVLRDDLLHPLANGNKARKLDALLPLLRRHGVTDVVTCGGCQSAHAAAVAVYCSERGIRPHLLLRGEQPEIPTGYNLISLMFGNVTYIARPAYAKRDEMLREHARKVAGDDSSVLLLDQILGKNSNGGDPIYADGSRRVVVVNEGGASAVALLGILRLVKFLSDSNLFGKGEQINIVVDAGTGTTAVGLAMGAMCLGLPWRVTAVMLADTIERYKEQEKCLISEFKRSCLIGSHELMASEDDGVQWVERLHPRKFGKVMNGEISLCRQIAQQTGVLLDPIYTLAAWEHAVDLSIREDKAVKVVMIHTGGTLGMFGLAQRFASHFSTSGE